MDGVVGVVVTWVHRLVVVLEVDPAAKALDGGLPLLGVPWVIVAMVVMVVMITVAVVAMVVMIMVVMVVMMM